MSFTFPLKSFWNRLLLCFSFPHLLVTFIAYTWSVDDPHTILVHTIHYMKGCRSINKHFSIDSFHNREGHHRLCISLCSDDCIRFVYVLASCTNVLSIFVIKKTSSLHSSYIIDSQIAFSFTIKLYFWDGRPDPPANEWPSHTKAHKVCILIVNKCSTTCQHWKILSYI